LVIEDDRDRFGAISKPQDVGEFSKGEGQELGSWERSEVGGPIRQNPSHGQDSGGWFLGNFYESEASFPFVFNVVPGPPALDQPHLPHQRGELVRDIVPLDIQGVLDELRGLLARLSPEIGEEAAFYPDGLPYVKDLFLGTQHLIDTRAVFGLLPDVSSETWVEDHKVGRPALIALKGSRDLRFSFGQK